MSVSFEVFSGIRAWRGPGPRMLGRLGEIRANLGPAVSSGMLWQLIESFLLWRKRENPIDCLDLFYEIEPTLDVAHEYGLLLMACSEYVDETLIHLRGQVREDAVASGHYLQGLLTGFRGTQVLQSDDVGEDASTMDDVCLEWTAETLQAMQTLGYLHGTSIREQRDAQKETSEQAAIVA